VSIREAMRSGRLTLEGGRQDIKAFPDWFALSPMAEAGRQPPADKS